MTLRLAFVSTGYFGTLGTTPRAGRLLSPADADSPVAPAAVVSDALWQAAFGRRPIDGSQTLRVAGRKVTVVGVAPPGFPGLSPRDVVLRGTSSAVDIWVPAASARAWGVDPPRDWAWLMLAGRPSVGRSLASARAEAASVAPAMAAAARDRRDPVLAVYASGNDWSEDPVRAGLAAGLFLLVPLCILGIGCANTINLQLAHAHERTTELAIRMALGSSRTRVVRMMAADTAVVAVLSSLACILATRAIVTWSEGALELPLGMGVSDYALAAILAAAIVATAGAVPAWIATRNLAIPGSAVHTTDGVRHQRLRLTLVVLQIAVCTALLFVSAIGVRSLLKLSPAIPPGGERTAVIDVRLDEVHPGPQGSSAAFARRVLDRLAAEPGIDAAGFAEFSAQPRSVPYSAPGSRPAWHLARGGFVSASWTTAMGLPLVSGRVFVTADGPNVALINRELRTSLDPGQVELLVVETRGALPRLVSLVGVVDTPGLPPHTPMVFLPMPLSPPASIAVVARGESPEMARAAVRDAVSAADPLVPVDGIDTLASAIERETGGLGQIVHVGGVVSLAALLIAAAGIYSLMVYSVQRRTREFGIRIAIGAGRTEIVRLVGREAMWAYGIGAGLGLAVGVGIATLMRAALFGLSPIDPFAFWPVAAGLLAVTVLASAAPVVAATRIDPVRVLRASRFS